MDAFKPGWWFCLVFTTLHLMAHTLNSVTHLDQVEVRPSVRPDWKFWPEPEPEPDCYDLAGTGTGTGTGLPS